MDPNCVKTCATCKHDADWDKGISTACSGCVKWSLFTSKDEHEETTRETVSKFFSALDTQVGGDHYKDQGIQPIEFIFANKLGFCEGNVIKYVTRYQKKNGVQDLKKARHYLDMLIEQLEKTDAA